MNSYKEEWLRHTLNLPELQVKFTSDGQLEFNEHIIFDVWERYAHFRQNPLVATGEAFFKAYMISKIDGPLPIADAVGLAYAIFDSSMAWYEYFTD